MPLIQNTACLFHKKYHYPIIQIIVKQIIIIIII